MIYNAILTRDDLQSTDPFATAVQRATGADRVDIHSDHAVLHGYRHPLVTTPLVGWTYPRYVRDAVAAHRRGEAIEPFRFLIMFGPLPHRPVQWPERATLTWWRDQTC